ncbi:hypothetical protein SACE_2035 [Saccharopolyspora erythraea NRRL 2338]|uniref:Uncharacterized protein n=1 Tax=Saccharopolyspora erythraea (strain ATCC 11635 / DSM 40517 / JCM 4748 / NBRC 13426 / NCIMB 8594 / NRRL 2338) TaxID=405948 RepID=A4FBC0_SACEN|nr:hypothetical protein SACE_2035 [Saccharopolyspora erythraea NRRL 2338]
MPTIAASANGTSANASSRFTCRDAGSAGPCPCPWPWPWLGVSFRR